MKDPLAVLVREMTDEEIDRLSDRFDELTAEFTIDRALWRVSNTLLDEAEQRCKGSLVSPEETAS